MRLLDMAARLEWTGWNPRPKRQHYCVDFDSAAASSSALFEEWDTNRVPVPADDPTANAVSSEIPGRPGQHRPVLDLDFPCQLVPSSTPGHFHLYMNGPSVPWVTYRKLLVALADCYLIESGYLAASIEREATFVRLPGVAK